MKKSPTLLTLYLLLLSATHCLAQDFWIKSGLDSSDVQFLTVGPDSSLFAGVDIPGVPERYTIYRSTNAGISWFQANDGLPQSYLISSVLFTDRVRYTYLALDSGVFRIQSYDTVWTKIPSLGSGGLSAYAISNSAGLMFFGTYGGSIVRSSDQGESWQLSYFAFDTSMREIGEVRSLAICQSGDIVASIKTFPGAIWIERSTDGGISWQTISRTGYYYDKLAVSPSGSLLGIINFGPYLFRSTDEGETWAVRDSSLAGNSFASIAFDASGKLYACGAGVFVSSNEGADWLNITHNLPGGFHTLALGLDGHMYVGALDNGVWKSAQRVTSVANERLSNYPKQFELFQNYPNPFNPTTLIRFDLPTSTLVRLTVYDVLGREISTPVNQFQQAGSKSVTFDASRLSSGIYFYRLQAGNPSASSGHGFTDIKKMLLLK